MRRFLCPHVLHTKENEIKLRTGNKGVQEALLWFTQNPYSTVIKL